MSRLLVLFVLVCALFVVECTFAKKDALTAKLMAARKHVANAKQVKELHEAARQRALPKSGSKFDLKKSGGNEVEAAQHMSQGEKIAGNILNNAGKRGIDVFSKGKSSKKSYEEVFYMGEFVEQAFEGFAMAPCSVGLWLSLIYTMIWK
ncbi:uncharacterized protein LOC100372117 [Saccoglossus kowalevskii]|uniref:Uncharacterized protein LOC100372117 n=1 Tax=Saccoglossus kowalevskii TaxID=10224 RepID=A0ABM0GPN3_SACKO|nr:PREDICTED: uncharacterized protein LOC100372117 [Saccoglossus kowalevskii]